MSYPQHKYKAVITNVCMWIEMYDATIDGLNAKINEDASNREKPLKVEIYENNNIYKHPALTDWTLIETREIK